MVSTLSLGAAVGAVMAVAVPVTMFLVHGAFNLLGI